MSTDYNKGGRYPWVRKRDLLYKRGDLVLVNFDEMNVTCDPVTKTRPAIVVQNDLGNTGSTFTIVVPITSTQAPRFATQVYLPRGEGNIKAESTILCENIMTIHKGMIVKVIGTISPKFFKKVEKAMKISLGLITMGGARQANAKPPTHTKLKPVREVNQPSRPIQKPPVVKVEPIKVEPQKITVIVPKVIEPEVKREKRAPKSKYERTRKYVNNN